MPDRARLVSRLALVVFTLLLLAPSAAHGQAAVYVTPDNQARQVSADTTGVVLNFVVDYSGTELGVGFSVSCTASLGSCASVTPETFSLNPNQSQVVTVVWDAGSVAGVGTVDLFAIGGAPEILSDAGYYTVTVVGAIPSVSGVADPLNLTVPPPSASAYFNVTNVGRRAAIFTFQCGASAPLGQCTPPTSVSIPKDSTVVVEAAFPVGATGSGAIWLQATADAATSVDTVSASVVAGGGTPVIATVTSPDTFDIEVATEFSTRFYVSNVSTTPGRYELSCAVEPANLEWEGVCNILPNSPPTVAADSLVVVEVFFHPDTTFTGTGRVILTATNAYNGQWVDVDTADVLLVVPPPPPPPSTAPEIIPVDSVPTITMPAGQNVAFHVWNPSDQVDVVVTYHCMTSGEVATCNPERSGDTLVAAQFPTTLNVFITGSIEGSGTLTVIAEGGSGADTAVVNVTVIGETVPPVVNPKGDTATATVGVAKQLAFQVFNNGTATRVDTLTCNVSPAVTGGCAIDPPDPSTIAPRDTLPVTVTFEPEAATTYTVSLTARGGGLSGGSDTGSYAVVANAVPVLLVTPDGASKEVLVHAGGVTVVDTFTVIHTGAPEVVSLSRLCTGAAVGCAISADTFTLGNPGTTSRPVYVTYGPVSATGTARTRVTATIASGALPPDSGWVNTNFVGAPVQAVVSPQGESVILSVGVEASLPFQIQNGGTATGTYDVACGTSSGSPACQVVDETGVVVTAQSIGDGQTKTVYARLTSQSAAMYTLTLTATLQGGQPSSGWYQVDARTAVLAVTPKGTSDRLVLADSMYADTFTVSLSGIDATVSLVAACSGIATNCSTPAAQALGPGSALGESVEVPITYTVSPQPGASTGRVTLRANKDGANALSDSGWVNLRLPLSLTVDDANPGLEELRGECLSIAAGAGAIECDDFRYVYPFLPVKRLNRVRNIGLLYNSEAASGGKIIGANLTLPLGATPEGVEATLWVAGQMVDSVMHREALPSGKPVRLALEAVDTVSAEVALIPYEVRVIAMYAGSPGVADTVTAAGHYLRVHRREEFGRGWWPTGYESLTPVSDSVLGNGLVWTGGDGSARLYLPIDSTRPDTFFAVTRGVPDFIVADSIRVGGSTGSPAPDTAYALNLNGSKGGIRAVGTHTGLTSANKLTWAFWIKPNGQSGRIGGVYASGDPNRVWWFEADNSGQELMVVIFNPSAGCCGGEPVYRVTSGGTFTQNAWNFVVVQFDGNQTTNTDRLKVWVNDLARSVAKPDWAGDYLLPSAIAAGANSPFEWGRISAMSPGFTGQMGETAILQNVLTTEQRSDWLTSGIDFGHPDLVAGYEWKGGLSDVSTAGNHLSSSTITGPDYVTTTGYPSRGTPSGGGGSSSAPFEADGYVRKLLGGGQVLFDATGRHVATVDRNGNETVFVHDTLGQADVRLVSIDLPTRTGPEPVYQFEYDPVTLELDAVKVLGGTGNWLTYSVSTAPIQAGAFEVRSITAPDGPQHTFGYGTSTAGVMDTITDHRNAKTQISYTHGKVDTVRVVTTDPNQTATLAYDAYSLVGIDTLTGARVPVPADSVGARLDGVRTDVADTTRFLVAHWGAVKEVRNAKGHTTRIERSNGDLSGIVTAIEYPNGRRISREGLGQSGLPSHMVDNASNPIGITSFEWDEKWRKPTRIESPGGVVEERYYDPANGNLLWHRISVNTVNYWYDGRGLLDSIRTPEGGATTAFAYDPRGNAIKETSPLGVDTRWEVDFAGAATLQVTPIIAGDSIWTVTYRDQMGRDTLVWTTNSKDAQWVKVSTTYDPATKDRVQVRSVGSDPITPTDSTSTGLTAWTYDQLGRVKTETDAAKDELIYDVAGNVKQRRRGTNTVLALADSMVYDELNQLVKRFIPEKPYSAAEGLIDVFPYYTAPGSLVVPKDSSVFTYDSMGNIETANNRYAQVTRSYELDGLLKTEIARIRDYDGEGFATHAYTTSYFYDEDRRLKELHHPTQLQSGATKYAYDPAGRLFTVTTPSNQVVSYAYDQDGRLARTTLPAGTDTTAYDLDGRVTWRRLRVGAVTYIDESIQYDLRNLVTGTSNPGVLYETSDMEYSGLGHLAESVLTHWNGAPATRETFTVDGFGRVVVHDDWSDVDIIRYAQHHGQGEGGAIEWADEEWAASSPTQEPSGWKPGTRVYTYDNNGNRDKTTEWRYAWELSPNGGTSADSTAMWREESKSFYSSDDRLMFHQVNRDYIDYTGSNPDSGRHAGAFEEYWYDALGRRVLKRSRQEDPHCNALLVDRCLSSVERYVWSGDQLLWELRSINEVDLDDTDPTPDVQNGKIGYVHAGGIDAPLAMIRNGATVFLHRNWRGLFAFGTKPDGSLATCTPSPWGGCDNVQWAAGFTSSYLATKQEEFTPWYGSVVTSFADGTGLLYRRNRYYDPASGQFTQEDPIGIAGGLNLYGYAGGDPINFSDAFGLSKCDDIEDAEAPAKCEEEKGSEESVTACVSEAASLAFNVVLDGSTYLGIGLGVRAGTSAVRGGFTVLGSYLGATAATRAAAPATMSLFSAGRVRGAAAVGMAEMSAGATGIVGMFDARATEVGIVEGVALSGNVGGAIREAALDMVMPGRASTRSFSNLRTCLSR